MKTLNKTLLALAIASTATVATAATVTPISGIWGLSQEGLSVGQVENSPLPLRVILGQQHDSGSFLKLAFPANVDFSQLESSLQITDGSSVSLTESDDVGEEGIYVTGTDVGDSVLSVDVGNGSFSFIAVTYNKDEKSFEFESGIGQPLINGASINVTLGGSGSNPIVSGVATAQFSSKDAIGNHIEDSATAITEVKQQFTASVTELMAETVQRLNNDKFLQTDLASSATSTIGQFKLTNDQSLKALAVLTDLDLELMSDFVTPTGDVAQVANDYAFVNNAISPAADTVGTFNPTKTAIDYTLTSATDLSSAASTQTFQLNFESTAAYDLQNNFNIKANIDLVSGTANGYPILVEQTFGAWKLDAAIINVPYMPIGFQASNGIDAVFEISNHGPQDAQIVIRAFDQDGTVYPATPLVDAEGGFDHGGFAASNTVTKVSDKDVMETFGLVDGDKRKLNITFEIDAKRADIDLVPYYKQDGVRAPIINSQYKDSTER